MTGDDAYEEIALMFRPLFERPWVKDAACAGAPLDIFFSEDKSDVEFCKDICSTCPVKLECLQDALANEDEGVRGGSTQIEREKYKVHQGRYWKYYMFDVEKANGKA